jgi:AcrR family transcriptional regulator
VPGIEGLRERKRAHSRATTVDVALELFAERGYEHVTVNDICAAAQIAPRTFFRYFPTKDDVLAEPARDMAERVAEFVTAAPAELADAEVLELAMRQLGRYVLIERSRLAAFLRVAGEVSTLRPPPLMRLADGERELVEQLLRRRPAGSSPDWRTRLLVARAVAAFRVWLGDLAAGTVPDPLQHLDEILAAP